MCYEASSQVSMPEQLEVLVMVLKFTFSYMIKEPWGGQVVWCLQHPIFRSLCMAGEALQSARLIGTDLHSWCEAMQNSLRCVYNPDVLFHVNAPMPSLLDEQLVWGLLPRPMLLSSVHLVLGSHGTLHERCGSPLIHEQSGASYSPLHTDIVINCHSDPAYALQRALHLDELGYPLHAASDFSMPNFRHKTRLSSHERVRLSTETYMHTSPGEHDMAHVEQSWDDMLTQMAEPTVDFPNGAPNVASMRGRYLMVLFAVSHAKLVFVFVLHASGQLMLLRFHLGLNASLEATIPDALNYPPFVESTSGKTTKKHGVSGGKCATKVDAHSYSRLSMALLGGVWVHGHWQSSTTCLGTGPAGKGMENMECVVLPLSITAIDIARCLRNDVDGGSLFDEYPILLMPMQTMQRTLEIDAHLSCHNTPSTHKESRTPRIGGLRPLGEMRAICDDPEMFSTVYKIEHGQRTCGSWTAHKILLVPRWLQHSEQSSEASAHFARPPIIARVLTLSALPPTFPPGSPLALHLQPKEEPSLSSTCMATRRQAWFQDIAATLDDGAGRMWKPRWCYIANSLQFLAQCAGTHPMFLVLRWCHLRALDGEFSHEHAMKLNRAKEFLKAYLRVWALTTHVLPLSHVIASDEWKYGHTLAGSCMMNCFQYTHVAQWMNGVGRQEAQFLTTCLFGLTGISPSDPLSRSASLLGWGVRKSVFAIMALLQALLEAFKSYYKFIASIFQVGMIGRDDLAINLHAELIENLGRGLSGLDGVRCMRVGADFGRGTSSGKASVRPWLAHRWAFNECIPGGDCIAVSHVPPINTHSLHGCISGCETYETFETDCHLFLRPRLFCFCSKKQGCWVTSLFKVMVSPQFLHAFVQTWTSLVGKERPHDGQVASWMMQVLRTMPEACACEANLVAVVFSNAVSAKAMSAQVVAELVGTLLAEATCHAPQTHSEVKAHFKGHTHAMGSFAFGSLSSSEPSILSTRARPSFHGKHPMINGVYKLCLGDASYLECFSMLRTASLIAISTLQIPVAQNNPLHTMQVEELDDLGPVPAPNVVVLASVGCAFLIPLKSNTAQLAAQCISMAMYSSATKVVLSMLDVALLQCWLKRGHFASACKNITNVMSLHALMAQAANLKLVKSYQPRRPTLSCISERALGTSTKDPSMGCPWPNDHIDLETHEWHGLACRWSGSYAQSMLLCYHELHECLNGKLQMPGEPITNIYSPKSPTVFTEEKSSDRIRVRHMAKHLRLHYRLWAPTWPSAFQAKMALMQLVAIALLPGKVKIDGNGTSGDGTCVPVRSVLVAQVRWFHLALICEDSLRFLIAFDGYIWAGFVDSMHVQVSDWNGFQCEAALRRSFQDAVEEWMQCWESNDEFLARVHVFLDGTPEWVLPYYALGLDVALQHDMEGGSNELGPSNWDSGKVLKGRDWHGWLASDDVNILDPHQRGFKPQHLLRQRAASMLRGTIKRYHKHFGAYGTVQMWGDVAWTCMQRKGHMNDLLSFLTQHEVESLLAPSTLVHAANGEHGVHFGIPHDSSILMRNGGVCCSSGETLVALLVPIISGVFSKRPELVEVHECHPLSVVRLLGLFRCGGSFVQWCVGNGFEKCDFSVFEKATRSAFVWREGKDTNAMEKDLESKDVCLDSMEGRLSENNMGVLVDQLSEAFSSIHIPVLDKQGAIKKLLASFHSGAQLVSHFCTSFSAHFESSQFKSFKTHTITMGVWFPLVHWNDVVSKLSTSSTHQSLWDVVHQHPDGSAFCVLICSVIASAKAPSDRSDVNTVARALMEAVPSTKVLVGVIKPLLKGKALSEAMHILQRDLHVQAVAMGVWDFATPSKVVGQMHCQLPIMGSLCCLMEKASLSLWADFYVFEDVTHLRFVKMFDVCMRSCKSAWNYMGNHVLHILAPKIRLHRAEVNRAVVPCIDDFQRGMLHANQYAYIGEGVGEDGPVVNSSDVEAESDGGAVHMESDLVHMESDLGVEFVLLHERNADVEKEEALVVGARDDAETESESDEASSHDALEAQCMEQESIVGGEMPQVETWPCIQTRRAHANVGGAVVGDPQVGDSIQALWEHTWLLAEFKHRAYMASKDGYDYWVRWSDGTESSLRREDIRLIDSGSPGLTFSQQTAGRRLQ